MGTVQEDDVVAVVLIPLATEFFFLEIFQGTNILKSGTCYSK